MTVKILMSLTLITATLYYLQNTCLAQLVKRLSILIIFRNWVIQIYWDTTKRIASTKEYKLENFIKRSSKQFNQKKISAYVVNMNKYIYLVHNVRKKSSSL